MNDPGNNREIRFSSIARRAMHEILQSNEQLDDFEIDEIISCIELACGAWTVDDPVPKNSRIKSEIEVLANAVDEFLEAANDLSSYARGILDDSLNENGLSVQIIHELVGSARSGVQDAIRNIEVTRGRLPNHAARITAYCIAACLRERGLKVNTYDDGLYFQVLQCALNESIPGIGEEAYRRHGEWAINNKDNLNI